MSLENYQPDNNNPLENNENQENQEKNERNNLPQEDFAQSVTNLQNFVDNINNEISNIINPVQQNEIRTRIRQLQEKLKNMPQLDARYVENEINEVYNIINNYYQKISPEINNNLNNINERKKQLLSPSVSLSTLEQLKNDENMTMEDKLLLLTELSKEPQINNNDILILAACMWFECWILSTPVENWETIQIPYIQWNNNLFYIIMNWEIYSGINENEAILAAENSARSWKNQINASLWTSTSIDPAWHENNRWERNFEEYKLKWKIQIMNKTPFNLKISSYATAQATWSFSWTEVKAWYWTNISYTRNIWNANVSLTGWIYHNLFQGTWTIEFKPSTKLSIWWNVSLPDNRSIWATADFTLWKKNEYALNLWKQIGDDIMITWSYYYNTQINTETWLPAGATYRFWLTRNF